MTPDEWFSCKRKVRYNREKTAREAARKMNLKTGGPLEPYVCSYCPGWHIGRPRTGLLKQLRLLFEGERSNPLDGE